MIADRLTEWVSRRLGRLAALVVLVALVVVIQPSAVASSPATDTDSGPKPTIVLVHGAFADASGWSEVTERLQKRGYTMYAYANPLRNLIGDADYLRTFLGTLEGPLVLVGHSYGGAVITNAATGNPNVTALVYIAAFAPTKVRPSP